ncbi:HigA family addiction module antitoxin [Bacteroides sp. 519]|uniref:HigA family addiction module antitoxin n=1 Tax=Bacteroides sp. 519 TaxID=2302937 RepID=UPI0013D89F74|nr:HigA family addiction module antitoxin [Bacteroides sp. 519]NDV59641.1 addiction module antidote protein, HigA family [Bacteroides sp. 519]
MIKIKGVDPKMIANNLTPFEPTHPGEILKDEIDYRGITQRELASKIGISYTQLNEILNCKRPINTEVALMVEAALGLDPEALINMQTRYNMQMARKDTTLSQKLEKIRSLCASLL